MPGINTGIGSRVDQDLGVPYWNTRYISALSVLTTSDTTQTITATLVGVGYDGVSFEYSTDLGATWNVKGTSSTGIYNATGLTAGTLYLWRTRLYKGANYGGYSTITGSITPYVLLKDTFSAADNTQLVGHAMEVGSGWTAFNVNNTLKITSNKAVSSTVNATNVAYSDATSADYVITADIEVPDELNYISGLYFRIKSTTEWWRIFLERDAGGTPFFTLKQYSTVRGTANVAHTAGVNDLKIVCFNETIEIWWNGNKIIEYLTSSVYRDGQGCGVAGFIDASYKVVPIDNFIAKECISNSFDGLFTDSIEYATGRRNGYAKYDFYYSGTEIYVKVNPLYFSTNPSYSSLQVYVNGVWNQTVLFTNTTYKKITLPAGASKLVRLIEGYMATASGNYYGTYITGIVADATFVKKSISNVSDKLILCGDSIIHGAYGTDSWINGIAGKFNDAGNNIAMYSGSSGSISLLASDAGKLAVTVAHVQSLFSNVATTKRLLIELGTNDAGVLHTLAATFKTQYSNLLNAIHAADPQILIYCLSPVLRNDVNEAGYLVDYRTGIADLCTSRDYTTYINGVSILTYPGDYQDNVHPNDGGLTKLYNALTAVIYPV